MPDLARELREARARFGTDSPEAQAAFDARMKEVLVEEATDESQSGIWYLSFVDPVIAATIPLDEQRPGGPSFLGGCYVEAEGVVHASIVAHALGCNPGGQVAAFGPLARESLPNDVELGILYNAEQLGY